MRSLNSYQASTDVPPSPTGDVDIYELITVTARLKEVLTRETEHLKLMQVKELAKLQEEKQKLTKTLEAYQRLIAARPELVRALDEGTREELAEISEAFGRAVAENMHRVAIARTVNQRVVNAIMEVVSENQHAGTYNRYGSAGMPNNLSVSFNLNQKA
jgi:flagellar biosynthesis/type III secretory pathway chaperone